MKKKDFIGLIVAAAIFLVAGYLGYTQLAPKSDESVAGVEVEVIGIIPSTLAGEGKTALQDGTKARNFNTPVDLSGLNNPAPFGQ